MNNKEIYDSSLSFLFNQLDLYVKYNSNDKVNSNNNVNNSKNDWVKLKIED